MVDLVCFNDVTPSDCGLLDGEYLGAALRCDEDPDGDGVTGCGDACPYDPDKTEGGLCGCGIADDDTDGDGVLDCFDQCPDTDPGAVIDEFGCEHRGACCFAVGVCVDDVPSVDCAFVGGVFQGRNTTCAADCRFPGNGDVDGNGVIDLLDAAYWASCMTGPGVSLVDDVCRPLDMDGEGAIDLRDAAVFANRFLD